MLKFAFVLLALAAVASAHRRHFATKEETMHAFKNLLSLPQMLSRDQDTPEAPFEFKWDDCSSGDAIAHLKELSISPDPIPLPGNITVSAQATSSAAVSAPLKASVELYKKVGIWVKIPCIDQIGSCDYDDVCQFLPSGDCPPVLAQHNIPCHCPFPAGNFTLPSSPINIEVGNLPSWLANGDYHAKGTVTDSAGKTVTCVEAYVSLKVA